VTDNVIQIDGLVKHYGPVRALQGVDLSVHRGEVFGFIGPNGSGKSTTIRILLDLLRPTRGSFSILGVDNVAKHPDVRARIGYLPGDLAMVGKRTGRELLGHLADLRGGAGLDRVEELAERFSLDLDRPFHGLSKGNKQKIGVVQAFMHRPDLLILDEPTSGLDPLLQREFLQLVQEANEDGATVFMSSHVLSEVDAVAGRVAIIRAGVIVDVEDVTTLKASAGQHVALTFAGAVDAAEFDAIDGLTDVALDGLTLSGVLRGPPDRLLKLAARHEVTAWSARDRSLEELFMDRYREPDEVSA
jgi:ABC-2 type transport system ATP-binding protein